MTNISKLVTNKSNKTVEELEAALTKAMQGSPECQGMKVFKLIPLENNGVANWDAEFVAEPGVTMSAECKCVLLGAKLGVQKHFDLAAEG
jgi:hypothetical protein